MKKQNNILKLVKQITNVLFISLLFHACVEEDIIKTSNVEEGVPVEVNLSFFAPDMATISTRSLTDVEENNINDIYVLIFDLQGNRVDGQLFKKGVDFTPTTHNSTTNTGNLTLKTTSGERRIYGIANVVDNELNGNGQDWLLNQLENLSSIQDLEKLTVAMDITKSISIDRVSPNMVMSGELVSNGSSNSTPGYCQILPEKGSNINGVLNLKRLDSKITFDIRLGSKITKFEPKEYQVFNVPVKSYVLEQNKDAGGITNSNNYANSIAYNNQFIKEEEDTQSASQLGRKYLFTFYQLENLKKSKDYGNEKLTDYKMREAEVKESDGSNSGEYKFVEPFASYVQIKAYMEIALPDGTTRVANIRIVVHLGGKDNAGDKLDYTNFNNRRNRKYTYTVTINDADDIVTEVKVNEENRPGIEGDVIDSKTSARILDAHYCCFNVELSYNDVLEMGFHVYTPFAEVTTEYKSYDKDTKQPNTGVGDYKWVKFKYNGSQSDRYLANYTSSPNYPNDDSKNDRLNIYELRKDVMSRGRYNPNKKIRYTVFVDEYYYKEAPCEGLNWGTDKTTYWKNFVNQDDRYIMLLYTPKKSADGDSSYGEAQYFIRQKSIQTYYSTTNLTDEKTALGMEHTNESPDLTYGGPANPDKDNGYYNTYKYINDNNTNWSNYVQTYNSYWKADTGNNTFLMSTTTSTYACLSRNRDKNGNGKIDKDELEWYVPTSRQLSSMYLGAQSLPSPLFTPPATGKVESGDTKYHFQTSDGDKIWAEEGCTNGSDNVAKQVRCVRNLGVEVSNPTNKNYNKVATPYKRLNINGRIIYDMNCVDPLNLRQGTITQLNYHVNFNETKNLPYYQFELAKNFHVSTKLTAGNNTWKKYNLDKGDLCSTYSEGSNDKGQWRMPNQRELLIIYNEGSQNVVYTEGNSKYGMYSSTYWLYSDPKYAGANQERTFAINAEYGNYFLDGNRNTNYGSILRCVRDVKITQ